MPTPDAPAPPPASAWAEPDPCTLLGCERGAIRATLFCSHHWSMLPTRLQEQCVRAFARRVAGDERADVAGARALTDALNYIHWMRGD